MSLSARSSFRFSLLFAACWVVLTAVARGEGYLPEEAVGRMKAADGLKVELVAGEPLVRQPVAIDFDDRGRLWVIQYLQYPNPEGLKRVKVDRYSRTVYDQVPQPPPHGPRGADRITILEDTNGDGRADNGKDFVAGLNLTSGFAFGHGGVFVLNVPYLLFYPDRNRDDIPDSDPEVLLTGFGMEDAHSVANSLTWGPDGWLYGSQGSTVTSKIRGYEFQQGVWRYHPLTRVFELFCEGGGNSWGLDFDRDGNLFYSTNHGGFVTLHGVQGAYLWKSFGKHGALHNPYAFGYFDHVPHTGFHGGHVSVGGLFYRGTTFPARFRDVYIAGDLLGHGVYWHKIKPRGSTFSSQHAGELLVANDTWFAPTDVALGPDGAIYVTDWHDKRTAHPDPDADWDRSNGRIYRIQAIDAKPKPLVDFVGLSSDHLVDLLSDPNDWIVRRARRVLAERRDSSVLPRLRTLITEAKDNHLALEALWALHVSGGFNEQVAETLLSHPQAAIRSWTVRFLGDAGDVSPEMAKRLAKLAANDLAAMVWSQLACSAKRLPATKGLPIVEALLLRNDVVNDPYLPLLLWWAIEKHSISAAESLVSWITEPMHWKNPLVHDFLLGRLMRRYAAEGAPAAMEACARLLSAAQTPQDRQMLLVELDQGIQLLPAETAFTAAGGTLFQSPVPQGSAPLKPGTHVVTLPAALVNQLEEVFHREPVSSVVMRLALRLGSDAAEERAVQIATQVNAPTAKRLEMLTVLEGAGRSSCVEALLPLINAAEPDSVKIAVLRLLTRFSNVRIPKAVLTAYPNLAEPVRVQARNLLFSRAAWSRDFLLEIDAGRYPAKDVSVDQLQRIALHHDADLDKIVRKHWGSVQSESPGEKLAEMRRFSNDLRAATGNADKGKLLFDKHCATCHRLFDRGVAIGPDLTHANRKDLSFLLSSLVDPGAQIRKEFLAYVIQTTDGQVATGLIVEQTPNSITLVDAKNVRTVIPREKIEQMQESSTSFMPDGILKPLSPDELRDLFNYLQK